MNIFLKLKDTPQPSPPSPTPPSQTSPPTPAASSISKGSSRSSQLSPSASVKSRESRRSLSLSQSISSRLQKQKSAGSGGSSVHTFSPFQSPELDSNNGFEIGSSHSRQYPKHSHHAHRLSGGKSMKTSQFHDRHLGHDHRRSLPDSAINQGIPAGGLKQKSRGIGRLIIPSLSTKTPSPAPASNPSPTSSITSGISPTTHAPSRPSSFGFYSPRPSMSAEMANSNGSAESDDGDGPDLEVSPTSTALDMDDNASINDNAYSPPASVFQEQSATCLQVQRIIGKRLMALEYLQEAYDCQLHWMNTSCCSPSDLSQRPYFAPQQLANRANHYLILGLSLSLILDPSFCDTPIEFIRAVHNCLHEFEIYQTSHPVEGASVDVSANVNGNTENKETSTPASAPSPQSPPPPPPAASTSSSSSSSSPFTTARARIPNVFKRNANQNSAGKPRRTSSATDAGQPGSPKDNHPEEAMDWGTALNNGMIGNDLRSLRDSLDTGYISPVDSMFMSQTSPTPSSQARWSGSAGVPESLFSGSSPPSNLLAAFEPPTPPSANAGESRPNNPELGSNDQYTYLIAPRLPFDPDFSPTFATLSGVLGDCYARVMEVSDSIDVWTPEFDDLFLKMDAKLQKLIINCAVKEFEDAHRSMTRNEMLGVGGLVFGTWV